MAKLSDHNKRYQSDDATAVAADIALGKTAWVSGTEIAGSAHTVPLSNYPHVDGTPRTLIEWQGPVGTEINPYTITAEDCLVADPTVTIYGNTGHLDSDGFIYGTGAYGQWARFNLPAKSTNERMIEIWGKITDPFVTDESMRIIFNFVDGSNYWEVQFYWHASSYLRCFIGEWLSGVYNFRGVASNLASGIAGPTTWFLTLHDGGDWIRVFFGAHEQDSPTEVSVNTTSYYRADRDNKTATEIRLSEGAVVGKFRASGFRISDVEW